MERLRQVRPSALLRSYGRTIVETSVFNAARVSGAFLLEKAVIPYVGRAYAIKETVQKEQPMSLREDLVDGGIKYPLVEEAVYRLVPSLVTNFVTGSKDTNYRVGTVSAVVFAAAHNVYRDKETGKRKFSTKSLPFWQFVGGMRYWKLQRERGFSHAVLSHGVSNVQLIALDRFFDATQKSGLKEKETVCIDTSAKSP